MSNPSYLRDLIAKDISHVLVDIRPAEGARRGFIQGAVNIPVGELAASKERFPSDKSAPIILYSDNKSEEEPFMTVRVWGYK